MFWFIIAHIVSTLFEWIRIGRLSDQGKDLEILILRHQLDILERHHKKPIRPTRVEKLTLAVLTHRLKRVTNCTTNQLRGIIRIFQPETVFAGIVNWLGGSGHESLSTNAAVLASVRKLKTSLSD